MTFEEWKEKHSDLIENVAITFFNCERGVDTKTCYDELEHLLKRAFNAGKGMNVSTKWHDLRKDPNDLPNGYRVVLNQVGMATEYHPGRGFLGFGGCGIIAWCEVPLFKEAE